MGKAAQKCTKCKKHGVEKLVKLHKQFCPYRTCGCKICEDVDRKRSQRARQTRERRDRRTRQILMEQQGLTGGELEGASLPVGMPGSLPANLPNIDFVKIKENEESQHDEYSRKYDGGACLPSGSPTEGPTAGAYPQLHVVSSISPPPPPSTASSASSPPPPATDLQTDYRPLSSTAPPTPPTTAARSTPSPSPSITEDVNALLWYFSRICWVCFAQVSSSEHHHVSRVLTNTLNELLLMFHQYPATSTQSSPYRRTPPPLPTVNHQHLYPSTAPPPVYSTPHRHHHHHHHHPPYRWPTPPPPAAHPSHPAPSQSPDNYVLNDVPRGSSVCQPAPLPPPPGQVYSPPPSNALLYSGPASGQRSVTPTPTQLAVHHRTTAAGGPPPPPPPVGATGPGTYTEETHISQYIRHAHSVQRCEEHRRLYPSEEHSDYRSDQAR